MLLRHSQNAKSLLDFLVNLMPGWDGYLPPGGVLEIHLTPRSRINSKAAKTLFSLWRDENNIMGEGKLKRPAELRSDELDSMQREGLIRVNSDTLEVTNKGTEVIRTMILGDEKSSFEDDGQILDFQSAFANTKPPARTAKRKKGKYAMEEKLSCYVCGASVTNGTICEKCKESSPPAKKEARGWYNEAKRQWQKDKFKK